MFHFLCERKKSKKAAVYIQIKHAGIQKQFANKHQSTHELTTRPTTTDVQMRSERKAMRREKKRKREISEDVAPPRGRQFPEAAGFGDEVFLPTMSRTIVNDAKAGNKGAILKLLASEQTHGHLLEVYKTSVDAAVRQKIIQLTGRRNKPFMRTLLQTPTTPVVPVTPRVGESTPEPSCPICMEVFSKKATLPCGHEFCAQCIGHHVDVDTSCPLCRKAFTTYETSAGVLAVEKKKRSVQPMVTWYTVEATRLRLSRQYFVRMERIRAVEITAEGDFGRSVGYYRNSPLYRIFASDRVHVLSARVFLVVPTNTATENDPHDLTDLTFELD